MDLVLANVAPFIVAIIIYLFHPRSSLSSRLPQILTTGMMLGIFFLFVGYLPTISEQGSVTHFIPWVPDLGLNLSFFLDGLSLLFTLVISGVGAVITIYVHYYFDDVLERNRFYLILMLFTGAMLGVVLAGNIITLFIAWELTSITSFLLIGFKGYKSTPARRGAFRAFIVTGIGALALIVGLVMLGVATGQITNPDDPSFVSEITTIITTSNLVEHPLYIPILVLIALGAFTKSAQFPFHFWLAGAREAPAPASSYLHSATMVKAGVYLLARMQPALGGSEWWTNLLVGVGLVTMFVGALLALNKRDLKGLLAYSTISKLGILVALIGLPEGHGIKAAMVGILAHALYKATLFLVAGTVDHITGTRVIDKLGGLRHEFPILAGIAVISGLSMAGVPFFFGFVAKETLLEAMEADVGRSLFFLVIISSIFTATAAFILIWDVFFREPVEKLNLHYSSPWIHLGPGILAIGSLSFGFLLEPVVIPLITPAVPKEFSLYLFPGINTIFIISLSIILLGFLLFLFRRFWLRTPSILPSGEQTFDKLVELIERVADGSLRLQSGRVRYYLLFIFSVVAVIFVFSGIIAAFDRSIFNATDFEPTAVSLAQLMLIVLSILGALFSVLSKNHLIAAVSLGVMGYSVGGIFLLEPAPDVALVQFLVETLATVLVIIMLGTISATRRKEAMDNLWKGNEDSWYKSRGVVRDAVIATIVGITIGIFAVIAVVNRPNRDTIADWYVDNSDVETGASDVVGAIVADFRATDTLIEIAVFAVAAIGVWTLFRYVNRQEDAETIEDIISLEFIQAPRIRLSNDFTTPFIRFVSVLVFPFSLLITVEHLLYGSVGAGDGFTAGVVAGLAITLWYVVFTYNEVQARLVWFYPPHFIRAGLIIALTNAVVPLLFELPFFAHISIDKELGIYELLNPTGLHITSALIFELAIALTVFGSVGIIIESIAGLRGSTAPEG